MSAREWKPGDVAMVRLDPETEIRVMYNGACWMGRKGTFYDLHASARPLVVIDPEDREQVERLTKALRDTMPRAIVGLSEGDTQTLDRIFVESTAAALREFANPQPPKPDEPTGLGAVVEDAAGKCWLRDFERGAFPWRPVETSRVNGRHAPNTNAPARASWGDITAVRVLSEGVTS